MGIDFEQFNPATMGGYYPMQGPNTELMYAPTQTRGIQQLWGTDWNQVPPDNFTRFPTALFNGFDGFYGVVSYETPEPNTLPYNQAYYADAPFDLQPIIDYPYPWQTGDAFY